MLKTAQNVIVCGNALCYVSNLLCNNVYISIKINNDPELLIFVNLCFKRKISFHRHESVVIFVYNLTECSDSKDKYCRQSRHVHVQFKVH